MKSEYQDITKEFLHKEIINTAKEQDLTDEQVAELLGISIRAYYHIKSGRNCCNSTTLLLYLINMCPDIDKFMNKAKTILL